MKQARDVAHALARAVVIGRTSAPDAYLPNSGTDPSAFELTVSVHKLTGEVLEQGDDASTEAVSLLTMVTWALLESAPSAREEFTAEVWSEYFRAHAIERANYDREVERSIFGK